MSMCVCVSVCVILITLLAGEGGDLFVEACNVHMAICPCVCVCV